MLPRLFTETGWRSLRRTVVLAALALATAAGEGAALTLTAGPTDTPPGTAPCTQSDVDPGGTGMTLHCTVGTPAAFADLYFGLANNAAANGMEMNGQLPTGGEIFRYSSSTARSITYTSTTTVDNLLGGKAENVNTRLVLTLIAGDGVVVDTGGTPANNAKGDIQKLFRISGNTFAVRVDVSSNHLSFPDFGLSNVNVFNRIHKAPMSGSTTEVNMGFYYLTCSP